MLPSGGRSRGKDDRDSRKVADDSQSDEKTLCQMHCAAVKEKGHGWVITSKEKPHVKD
jgi:hypothetical protein